MKNRGAAEAVTAIAIVKNKRNEICWIGTYQCDFKSSPVHHRRGLISLVSESYLSISRDQTTGAAGQLGSFLFSVDIICYCISTIYTGV